MLMNAKTGRIGFIIIALEWRVFSTNGEKLVSYITYLLKLDLKLYFFQPDLFRILVN